MIKKKKWKRKTIICISGHTKKTKNKIEHTHNKKNRNIHISFYILILFNTTYLLRWINCSLENLHWKHNQRLAT